MHVTLEESKRTMKRKGSTMIKQRFGRKVALASVLLAVAILTLAGCSQKESEKTLLPEQEIEKYQAAYKTVGQQTEGAGCITTENGTTKAIEQIELKLSEDDAFETEVMSNEAIEPEEEVKLYYQDLVTGEDDNDSDIGFRTLYDVRVTFDDGESVDLHDLNIPELKAMRICLSPEGVGYIEYRTAWGSTEDTLDAEKAIQGIDDESQEETPDDIESTGSEGITDDQSLNDSTVTSSPSYTESSGGSSSNQADNSSGGTSGSGSSASQTQDECIDDVVFD